MKANAVGNGAGMTTNDGYYLIVFGSQRQPNRPRFSHTFAVAVHAREGGGDPAIVDQQVISWLPSTKDIEPLRTVPEPGTNFALKETLDWASQSPAADPTTVYAWGPLKIRLQLFEHLMDRAVQLATGSVEYVVSDRIYRPDEATNCIHALSDLKLTSMLLPTFLAHGREASRLVLNEFARLGLLINPATHYPWVAKALHLEKYAIVWNP